METFNKPTYPRPDFARESWESLDGEWEFDLGERFQTAEEALGSDFEEKIQVPFCYQSQASGIGRTEDRDTVWYRREFRLSRSSGTAVCSFISARWTMRRKCGLTAAAQEPIEAAIPRFLLI